LITAGISGGCSLIDGFKVEQRQAGDFFEMTDDERESWNSPFGIFAAYTQEYQKFSNRMGFTNEEYWDWVDRHFDDLQAHWTRSNLQFIWDIIEPKPGAGYKWDNQMGTDDIARRISDSPVEVHWVAVFHEGGTPPEVKRPPLRNPVDYPDQYSRFVKAAVERYDGDGIDDLNDRIRVKYWQIGNEYPFWIRSGRNLNDYLNWARSTSIAIKEADPEARVVLIAETQGLTMEPWMKTAIQFLSPPCYIDVVDIHHCGTAAEWKMNAVPPVRSLLNSQGRTDAEIFSCEHGTWAGRPSRQPAQTEEEQARSLVKRYVYNLTNGLDKLMWNNLVEWEKFMNSEGSIFNSIGLISDGQYSGDSPDRLNTERIAYWSYRMLSKNLGNDIRLGKRIDVGNDDIYVYRFPAADRAGVRFVGWAENGQFVVNVPEKGFKGKGFTLIPDRFGDIGLKSNILANKKGIIEMKLGIDPVMIVAD